MAIDNICIAANGDVIPCAGWNDFILGNIHSDSLTDIWNHSDRLKYLRGIKEKDFRECIVCNVNNYCMRCMNRNYNECNGRIFETPQVFCDVAYLLKKISQG